MVRKHANGEEAEISVPAIAAGNDIRPVGSDIALARVDTCKFN